MTTNTFMRRLQAGSLVLAAFAAAVTLAPRLAAYDTEGHTWGTKSVSYYINPNNLYVSETSAVAAITSAASAWRGVANIDLVYAGYTSGSTLALNGRNEVFFRDDASGFIAETYWWWDGSGNLVDADIVFHENNKFYSANIGCAGDGFYIENTGAHEFGHLLGMAHSSVELATMWPNSGACETTRETLDADDIAGLKALYPGSSSPTTSPPAAPSGLSVSVNASSPSSSLVLTWIDNASDESGYKVERSSDGAAFAQVAQLGAGARSFTNSGLPAGTTFWYRVSAFNSAGTSPFSNVASGATQPASAPSPTASPTAPATPSSPIPGNGARNITAPVTLGWTAINATQFDVYVNNSLAASNLTTPSFRLSTVTPGAQYSWRVVAKNANGTTSGPTWSFSTKKGNGNGR